MPRGAASGVNHITLAVSDLERALAFYTRGLGLTLRHRWGEGAYLEAGSHWICLSLDPAARTARRHDYTHLAFDTDEAAFEAIVSQLRAEGAVAWKDNRSEGRSFYSSIRTGTSWSSMWVP